MGWKKVPGAEGLEVNEELTVEGKLLFKKADPKARFSDAISRVNGIFGSYFDPVFMNDPAIKIKGNHMEVRVDATDYLLKLFCANIDILTVKEIKRSWERKKWQNLPEQKLMEKCIEELYEKQQLSEQTKVELKEYQGFLKLQRIIYYREPDGEFDATTAEAHVFFMGTGLNVEARISGPEERKALQRKLNVSETGRYDLETARAVKALQQKLRKKRLYNGLVDGLWRRGLADAWVEYERLEEIALKKVETPGAPIKGKIREENAEKERQKNLLFQNKLPKGKLVYMSSKGRISDWGRLDEAVSSEFSREFSGLFRQVKFVGQATKGQIENTLKKLTPDDIFVWSGHANKGYISGYGRIGYEKIHAKEVRSALRKGEAPKIVILMGCSTREVAQVFFECGSKLVLHTTGDFWGNEKHKRIFLNLLAYFIAGKGTVREELTRIQNRMKREALVDYSRNISLLIDLKYWGLDERNDDK